MTNASFGIFPRFPTDNFTKTFTFTWNTTGIPYGNYTISSGATEVPNDYDTGDNTLTYGWILITHPCDITRDGKVHPDDFSVFAGSYGSNAGDPEYDSRCDFDNDGDVDPDDVAVFAGNYGKTIP